MVDINISELRANEGEEKRARQNADKICLFKTWESECGTVTINTCKRFTETYAEFVAKHQAKIDEMMELCPPIVVVTDHSEDDVTEPPVDETVITPSDSE
jgi:hypothetical protein